MGNAVIQLLVLAGIAVFLILRLRNVLGTRDGFERSPAPASQGEQSTLPELHVREDGYDDDIADHVDESSDSAGALMAMKFAEPEFTVGGFIEGARGAYEMILMSFERGDIDSIAPFLGDEVYQTFIDVVGEREDQGLSIDAKFVGIRDVSLVEATYDSRTHEAEITVRFVGELTSAVRNAAGEIVEGNPSEIRRQKDIWTFMRRMGAKDPNWKLVATGE